MKPSQALNTYPASGWVPPQAMNTHLVSGRVSLQALNTHLASGRVPLHTLNTHKSHENRIAGVAAGQTGRMYVFLLVCLLKSIGGHYKL